jgi:pentose-5-phosphate-3-epimerase
MAGEEKFVPELYTPLRSEIISMPQSIRKASGIKIFGRRIKSVLYTTDVAVIKNNDADAILAVYPFTPNTSIIQAISMVANAPVFAGVGGGLTNGSRCIQIAMFAEELGCFGVVFNGPIKKETIQSANKVIDCPLIYSVVKPLEKDYLENLINCGVDIFNVSGGPKTPEIVRNIRKDFPKFPIMATGGKTDESITEVIDAGANAVTFTAYGAQEKMFHKKMEKYRHD